MIAAHGDDAEHQHLRYIKQINAALAGGRPRCAVATHMCRGNFRSSWAAEGGYDLVAEALFNELRRRLLPRVRRRALRGVRAAAVRAQGQVSCSAWCPRSGRALESKDDLKRRIDAAAQVRPARPARLSPQCGFSSTVEGNALTSTTRGRSSGSSSKSRGGVGLSYQALRKIGGASTGAEPRELGAAE